MKVIPKKKRSIFLVGLFLLLAITTSGTAADKRKPRASAAASATELTNSGQHKRVALVIGNGDYKDAPLKNPPNDAEDVAATLRSLGFEVISRRNATQPQVKAAVREFGQHLRGAESGLFYFAGHGIQVKGINYLVPVGVDIQSEADAEDQSVSLDYVMRTMEESGARFNISILDACRNNPFARSFRSASRGLAQAQAASGMLVAYATAPGSVAADGTGRNGIYTKHLLKNLKEGDSDILKVFQRVRAGVVTETGGQQVPWESTSLTGDFYFKHGEQVANIPPNDSAATPPRVQSADEVEQEYWDSIRESTRKSDFEEYLQQYPAGRHLALAKQKIRTFAASSGPGESARPVSQNTPSSDPIASTGGGVVEPEMVAIPGKNYSIGKYEVTQVQWRSVMGSNPSWFATCGDACPVEQVSWNDVQEYIQKLNQRTGKQYRLPTYEEWKFACEGGESGFCKNSGSAMGLGWLWDNSDRKTHAVGLKQPNEYGLHDMIGNVWEWIGDSYKENLRLMIGCGYEKGYRARGFYDACRSSHSPNVKDANYGFRLAITN